MKTAVVLLNLGGPDRPESVEPFLFNLFFDPAIVGLAAPFRWLIAKLISSRRAPVAREIYANLGGGSPLLANTKIQGDALETALGEGHKIFIAMRYWHPRARETVDQVRRWGAERVILLPLYPQYSTTTTESSVKEWQREAHRAGLRCPTQVLCCYPRDPGFIAAMVNRVRDGLASVTPAVLPPRILFSAHGLPERIAAGGDPYQWQVERTVEDVLAGLGRPDIEHQLCYQSRVGPLKWIGPPTDSEIRRAGAEQRPLVVVPIAFVSEHSETLVELDIEYRHLATEVGVPEYVRVPTIDAAEAFIRALAAMVRETVGSGQPICSGAIGRICPAAIGRCAFQRLKVA